MFDLVFKSAAKVSENNVIQYLLLCSWALQMTQCKYEKEVKDAQSEVDKVNVEFQLANIAEVMKFTHFELIYKLLANEARLEKKHFKINVFHAALNFFKQYLDIIAGNTTSMSPSDRRNANALMGNMFRHDIARVLR